MAFIIGLGNKCLDLKGGVDANGTPIILFDPHGGKNQQWTLTSDGFIISNLYPGKCLDIPGSVTDNGTPITLFDKHGGANQKWSLTPEGLIVSALDQNKCLDVKEGTDANETPIILFDKHGGMNQKWRFSDTLPLKPAFPIKGSRHDDVAGGHMETSITLHNTGRMDGVTRTWTNVNFKGFTGGVCVVLIGDNNHRLWVSELRTYGVDGDEIPLKDSDRTEGWDEQVPKEVLNQVRGVAIVQRHAPDSRLSIWLKTTGEALEEIKPIIQAIALIAAA
jgi:hypothetical protein